MPEVLILGCVPDPNDYLEDNGCGTTFDLS